MAVGNHIESGFQGYAVEGGGEVGAVRGCMPQADARVVHVEHGGDFVLPLEAVKAVPGGQVIIGAGRLGAGVQ